MMSRLFRLFRKFSMLKELRKWLDGIVGNHGALDHNDEYVISCHCFSHSVRGPAFRVMITKYTTKIQHIHEACDEAHFNDGIMF